MSDSSERKSKPASQQKLRKSRRDGSVAQSQKTITLLLVACLMLVAILQLHAIWLSLAALFDDIFPLVGQDIALVWVHAVRITLAQVMRDVGVFMLTALVIVIIGSITYHRGVPFSIKPIVPDFKRLNPAQGFKRILGKRSWIETSAGLVQLVIWGLIAFVLVSASADQFLSLSVCSLLCWSALSWTLLKNILIAAIVVMIAFAVLEVILQQALYRSDQRMTQTEVNRERKDNFGAPEIRRARQKLRQENQLLDTVDQSALGVDKANMCFFTETAAVGIRYHPDAAPVPLICCNARTAEEVRQLRMAIRMNGFPELHSEALAATCAKRKAGTPVPPALYAELGQGIRAMYSN